MTDKNEKMLREIAFDAMTPKKTDKLKENEIFEYVEDEVEKDDEKKTLFG
jgi:hypothetical protein